MDIFTISWCFSDLLTDSLIIKINVSCVMFSCCPSDSREGDISGTLQGNFLKFCTNIFSHFDGQRSEVKAELVSLILASILSARWLYPVDLQCCLVEDVSPYLKCCLLSWLQLCVLSESVFPRNMTLFVVSLSDANCYSTGRWKQTTARWLIWFTCAVSLLSVFICCSCYYLPIDTIRASVAY